MRPPKVKVMPHVTWNASKGGLSIVLAQFDLGILRPEVQRPSLMFGLNGISLETEILKKRVENLEKKIEIFAKKKIFKKTKKAKKS